MANQEYDKAVDALNKYLEKKGDDADAWFQLGKIYADKGDFVDGIEIFQKSISLDKDDPKKKLFLGMLLAEVNRFSDSLGILKQAIEQSEEDSVVRRRCEDLIQQILEVSGIQQKEAEEKLGTKTARKARRKTKKKKVTLGSQNYVKVLLYSGLKHLRKLQASGWTLKQRKEMIHYIKYRLIRNYRKLIKYKKFSNKFTRRYYYLGIRKLIEAVKAAKATRAPSG
jgi:tetratricopeptide (TPR) repeat protein